MLVAALTEADVHGMKSTHRLAREFDPVRHPKVTQSQLVQDQAPAPAMSSCQHTSRRLPLTPSLSSRRQKDVPLPPITRPVRLSSDPGDNSLCGAYVWQPVEANRGRRTRRKKQCGALTMRVSGSSQSSPSPPKPPQQGSRMAEQIL